MDLQDYPFIENQVYLPACKLQCEQKKVFSHVRFFQNPTGIPVFHVPNVCH